MDEIETFVPELIVMLSPIIVDAVKTSVITLFTFLIALTTTFCGNSAEATIDVVTSTLSFATITIVGSCIRALAVAGVSIIISLTDIAG